MGLLMPLLVGHVSLDSGATLQCSQSTFSYEPVLVRRTSVARGY
jgi:hypothetical protein